MMLAVEVVSALLADVVMGPSLGVRLALFPILLEIILGRLRHGKAGRRWRRCRRRRRRGWVRRRRWRWCKRGQHGFVKARLLRERGTIGFGLDRSPTLAEVVVTVGLISHDWSDHACNLGCLDLFRFRGPCPVGCRIGHRKSKRDKDAAEDAVFLHSITRVKSHVTIVFLARCWRANRSECSWI